jgi:hypothetical protein
MKVLTPRKARRKKVPLLKKVQKKMTPKQKYRNPWNLEELGTTITKIPKVMTLGTYGISTNQQKGHPWLSCVRKGEYQP